MEDRDRQKEPESDADSRASKHSRARRQLLKSLTAGGLVAGAHVVPDRWVKPVVDAVVVPAHAQGSVPSMTVVLEFTDGTGGAILATVNGPGSAGVDGLGSNADGDEVAIESRATVVNPPVPGQNVTLSFAYDAGTSDWVNFVGPLQTQPLNPVADFDASAIITADLPDVSDFPSGATLTATFTSPGVPTAVVNITFG